jgi:hypothetical protein
MTAQQITILNLRFNKKWGVCQKNRQFPLYYKASYFYTVPSIYL